MISLAFLRAKLAPAWGSSDDRNRTTIQRKGGAGDRVRAAPANATPLRRGKKAVLPDRRATGSKTIAGPV
jgi:hypothetical protein